MRNNLVQSVTVVGEGLETSDAFVSNTLFDLIFADWVDGIGQGLRQVEINKIK